MPQFAPYLDSSEYENIKECFDLNWITEGPKSKEFLSKLLELTQADHGVFAPNGTLSLYLALKAAGIMPGDEVIVPDFTFIGSATSIEMNGATPVFCDIDRDTLQIAPEKIEERISEKTKAIMPVHIYGSCCNMTEVMKVASKYNLKVIEDAAQAIGVFWNGRHAGTIGDAGSFSFFADKTITTGEGGLIVTNNPAIHERLLYLRNQGRIERGTFIHPEIGYNFRITDIQAAIGLVQLGKLDKIKKMKSNIYDRYKYNLGDSANIQFIKIIDGSSFIPFRVAIYVRDKIELERYLELKGVQTRSFFYPLHRQPAFKDIVSEYSYEPGSFNNSVYSYDNGMCLPSFPSLTESQTDYVCAVIREFYNE